MKVYPPMIKFSTDLIIYTKEECDQIILKNEGKCKRIINCSQCFYHQKELFLMCELIGKSLLTINENEELQKLRFNEVLKNKYKEVLTYIN